jgi:hypothetical protein
MTVAGDGIGVDCGAGEAGAASGDVDAVAGDAMAVAGSGVPASDAMSRAIGDVKLVGEAAASGLAMLDGSGTPSGKRITELPPPPSPI